MIHYNFRGIDKVHLDFMIKELELSSDDVILDVGCGSGRYSYALHSEFNCEVIGIDIAAPQRTGTNDFPFFIKADAEELPFRSHVFDKIIARDVWAHMHNDAKFLLEIHRVLKLGGVLVVNAPLNQPGSFEYILSKLTCSYPLLPRDADAHHYHRYTFSNVKRRVEDTGFIIKKVSFGEFFLAPLIIFYLGSFIDEMRTKRPYSNQTIFKEFKETISLIMWQIFALENKLLSWCPFGSTAMLLAKRN